jgi:hypothetical protein
MDSKHASNVLKDFLSLKVNTNNNCVLDSEITYLKDEKTTTVLEIFKNFFKRVKER